MQGTRIRRLQSIFQTMSHFYASYLLHAASEVDSLNLLRKPTFKFILSAPDCLGHEEHFIDCIPPPAIFESFVCINNALSILYCAGKLLLNQGGEYSIYG